MIEKDKLNGLSSNEILELQKKYGKNELSQEKEDNFFIKILKIISEPMFILLLGAAIVYFLLGEPRDGSIMLVFMSSV